MTNKIGIVFKIILYVFLFSSSFSCSKNVSPSFTLPFDGSLATMERLVPHERNAAQYIGYRTRKALLLLPEDIFTYDISLLKLKRGTLEFWLKLDSSPPNVPIRLMKVSGKSIHFEILLNRRTIQLLYSESSGNIAQLLCSDQPVLTKSFWNLLALSWDSSEKLQSTPKVYWNGKLLETSPTEKRVTQKILEPSELTIGANATNMGTDRYVLNLRDLKIWSSVRDRTSIYQSYVSQSDEMNAPLVWPAANLRHFAGTKVKDADAAGGQAWTIDSEMAKADGIILPSSGKYELTFRIKPLIPIQAKNLSCRVWSSNDSGKSSSLAFWENKAQELTRLNVYENISLPFHASQNDKVGFEFQSWIPSKYSLLLDTVTIRAINGGWQLYRRFEDLKHTMGVWMMDPEASKSRSWTNANTLHYGPYVCIGQPGRYRATWRIKISSDAPSDVPLLLLDVFAHDGYYPGRRGHKPYAKLAVSAAEFKKRDHWEKKSLEFNYDGANMLEFRAFAKLMKPGVVRLDTITVERLQ